MAEKTRAFVYPKYPVLPPFYDHLGTSLASPALREPHYSSRTDMSQPIHHLKPPKTVHCLSPLSSHIKPIKTHRVYLEATGAPPQVSSSAR